MFHKVQDVDDARSNSIHRHACLLLMPNYFTNEGLEPLDNGTLGKLVMDQEEQDWSVVSTKCRIFVSLPE